MTVFEGANDALSGIRSRVSFGVEEERVEVPPYLDGDEKRLHRKYGIYFDRANDRAEAFKSIRLTPWTAPTLRHRSAIGGLR